MNTMPKRTLFTLLALTSAFAIILSLSTPAELVGYDLLGGSLDFDQRDFRVYNNFGDASANNNTTPDANFPGHTGAPLAIWKAGYEWTSVPRAGNGNGDPTQSNLGDGGANFDLSFQGTAGQVGSQNANIHSEIGGSSGSTLAFMEPGAGISDGWRIRYYATWSWRDGPGSEGGADIQGVACHEIGHSLGLDHSSAPGATMVAFVSGSGVGQRSINSDDIAGVQVIYGVKGGSKCEITGISGSTTIGESLVIDGLNFTALNNQVWFSTSANGGDPLKVTGIPSTNSNTRITVTIPEGAEPGDLLVKKNASGDGALSNSWPIDVQEAELEPPLVQSVNPTSGFPGGFTEVTIGGTGLSGATSVTFGATAALDFTVDSNTQITATAPAGPPSTTVDITVTDSEGSSTLAGAYTYTTDPVPSIDSLVPGTGSPQGGTTVTVSGASVLGVTDVTFDGVSGSNLEILGPTELQVDTPGGIGTVDVVVTGNGSDTLVAGFDYEDIGGFVDVGPGLAGLLGVPTLTGEGDQTPGSPVGFELTIGNSAPNAFGVWFWHLGTGGAVPFKQGTFYPVPVLFSVSFTFPPAGDVVFPLVWDPALPSGIQFTTQWWTQDAAAPAGSAGSNGLRLDVP